MNTNQEIKNILAIKKQLENNEIIGMVAVRELLESIIRIVTDNKELNNILTKIHNNLVYSDSCSVWEDIEYLENDFKALKKFAK